MGIWHSGMRQVQKLLGPSPSGILISGETEEIVAKRAVLLSSAYQSEEFCSSCILLSIYKRYSCYLRISFCEENTPHFCLSFSSVLLMSVLEQDGPYSSVNALILFSWCKWKDSVDSKCLHFAGQTLLWVLGSLCWLWDLLPVSAHSPAFAVPQYFVEDALGSISSHCCNFSISRSLFNLWELTWSVPSDSCGFICEL